MFKSTSKIHKKTSKILTRIHCGHWAGLRYHRPSRPIPGPCRDSIASPIYITDAATLARAPFLAPARKKGNLRFEDYKVQVGLTKATSEVKLTKCAEPKKPRVCARGDFLNGF